MEPGCQRLFRLKSRVFRAHLLLLGAGASALMLVMGPMPALSYALGTVLGALNFHLHSRAVMRLVAPADRRRSTRDVHMFTAASFAVRFCVLALVLGSIHLHMSMHLLPAAAGLLGTYAALIYVGIMDSYAAVAEAKDIDR